MSSRAVPPRCSRCLPRRPAGRSPAGARTLSRCPTGRSRRSSRRAISTEDARDRTGEAQTVMELADVRAGHDGRRYRRRREAIIRCGWRRWSGPRAACWPRTSSPQTFATRSASRVQRERLDNVAVKLGTPDDPLLPARLVRPRSSWSTCITRSRGPTPSCGTCAPALRPDGRVIVVDADRPTDQHGTPPRLLVCEFGAVGYGLTRFERLPDNKAYFAQFEARGPAARARGIPACNP